MGKYLKKFENHSAYEAAKGSLILPNVSLCVNENDVHYKPWAETRVVAKFNVTSTSSPTTIGYNQYTSGFSAIEIDGVELPSVVSAYTFDTLGEHTVKYTLSDPTSIGDLAFFIKCSGLTSVDIPSGVTSIGRSAFQGCSSLTSCTIGNGVTSIGDSAFYNCYSLTSITIPNGVTSIGSGAFASCSGLTSVDIPSGVTTIDSTAFQGCSSLTSCTIGSGVTSIGQQAFNGCSGLASVTIPNGVTSIGNMAFYKCSSLTSIVIPNSVTSIGSSAFQGCSGLTSCTIGSGVTSIGNSAFYNCYSLTSITVNASTPPTLSSSNAFDSTNNCPIYVPSGSVNAYKSASGWGTYTSRIQTIP